MYYSEIKKKISPKLCFFLAKVNLHLVIRDVISIIAPRFFSYFISRIRWSDFQVRIGTCFKFYKKKTPSWLCQKGTKLISLHLTHLFWFIFHTKSEALIWLYTVDFKIESRPQIHNKILFHQWILIISCSSCKKYAVFLNFVFKKKGEGGRRWCEAWKFIQVNTVSIV